MVYLSNQQQFPWSVLLLTIEMTSKCSKTTSCRRVVSLQSFEHFDVISMVNKSTDHGKLLSVCFFTTTLAVLTSISIAIFWKMCAQKREKQIAPPSHHFRGLYSYRTWLSTNQRGRNDSVIVKTLIEYRNDVKIFKTRVEPLAAGEWFHYKVLNMVFKNCIGKKNGSILTLHLCHH